MNTKPLVSILIPAYNAEKTIESCLDSIIVQESNNYEIVVIDDGSSDNTYSRLLKYKDKSQVTIIRQENKGVSLTRQALIENACGKYVLFCDADDFLAPTAIQSVCSVLSANDSDKKSKAELYVCLLYTSYEIIKYYFYKNKSDFYKEKIRYKTYLYSEGNRKRFVRYKSRCCSWMGI